MQRRQERWIQSPTPGAPNHDIDGNDLASAASWVAAEIMESAVDAGLAISQHEAYGSEMAEDARLPSSFLLASAVVAVPALVDAHAAAQAELSMPGPKVFMCNALVLVGSAVAFWFWVCIVTARLLPADADLSEVWVLAWVQGMPAAAWTSYQQQLASEPVLVKALLTGWTYIVGDMIAQIVQQTHEVARHQLRSRPCLEKLLRMDQRRYLRSGLIGFFPLGPLAHVYYEFVGGSLDHWPIACKIALDQTLYLAFYNTVYFLGLGVLAGRPAMAVLRQYRGVWWSLLTAGWQIWPWVGIVTYSYIPQEHRVLFVDLVEILYSAVLSTLTSTTSTSSTSSASTSGYSALPSVAPADDADPAGGGEVRHSRLASVAAATAASAASAAAAASATCAAAGGSAGCDAEMHLFSPSSRRAAARTPPSPLEASLEAGAASARSTAPACARPPSTWDELVEVGGPGGALSWVIAGELPETVTSRLERPANRERETLWKAFERFIFSDPVIGLK